jgi:tetratricopeptide (TPR) repeat protein
VYALQEYAEFLVKYKLDFAKGEELCKRAFQLYPQKSSCVHNWALFLMKYKKEYDQAEKYFEQALALDAEPAALHVKNYCWFLKHVRGMRERRQTERQNKLNYHLLSILIVGDVAKAEQITQRYLKKQS